MEQLCSFYETEFAMTESRNQPLDAKKRDYGFTHDLLHSLDTDR